MNWVVYLVSLKVIIITTKLLKITMSCLVFLLEKLIVQKLTTNMEFQINSRPKSGDHKEALSNGPLHHLIDDERTWATDNSTIDTILCL